MKWLLLFYGFISLWIYSDAQSCELEGVTSTQWNLAYENEPVDDTERTLFKRFNSAFITGVTVSSGDTTYFDVSFDADTNILELKPSANFARYEELTASTLQPIIGINLLFTCTDGSNDLRFNQAINDVNNNDPVFNSSLYSYNLPMPFPGNIEVTSFGVEIQAVDIDITNTQVTFSIEPAGDFRMTYDGLVGNLTKVHRARIFALRPLRLTEPTFYTLRVTDMGAPQRSTTSQLEITVDEEASLKQSPVFGEAFYIAEYAADATNKVEASLDVDLHGSTASSATVSGDHSELFECTASGSAVNVRLVGSLPEEVLLEKTFIALTVEVTVDDAEYTARTALIVSIPQPETTTTACPTETTMTTASCPEIPTTTECPECVCTTTESTPCPETTTATECVCTTTEITPCPETTTPTECVCTTPEVEPCPETTETTACVCSTTPEVTTSCPETTTSTECDCETTVCPSTTTVEIVTCPETTATTECTCPTTTETTTTETCEPCDCTSTATTPCPETTTSDTTLCPETPPTTECSCPTTDTTTTSEVCLPCPETTTECLALDCSTCITTTGSSLETATTECPIQDCSTCQTTTTDCPTTLTTFTPADCPNVCTDTTTTITDCPLDCSECPSAPTTTACPNTNTTDPETTTPETTTQIDCSLCPCTTQTSTTETEGTTNCPITETTTPTDCPIECPETSTVTDCPIECPQTSTVTDCPETSTVTDCPIECPETSTVTDCPIKCPQTSTVTDCPETSTVTDCPIECPETSTVTDCPIECPETSTVTDCPIECPQTSTVADCPIECPETSTVTDCLSTECDCAGTSSTVCPNTECPLDCSTTTPTTTTTTMTTTVTPEFTTRECPGLDCSLCTTASSLTTVTTGTPPNAGYVRFDQELYTFRLSPTDDIDHTFQAVSDVQEEIIYDLTNTEGPLPTALSFNRITGQLTNNGFLSSGLYQLVIMATGQETENTATAPVIISVGSAEVCEDGSVRTSYAFKLTSIAENTEGVVLFKGAREDLADYNFCIEHHYPQQTGTFHINEETGDVEVRAVDRESSIFAGMDPAQFTVTLQLNYGPVTQNCPITTMSSVQFAYTSSNNNTRATYSRQCVHMDSEIFNEPQKTVLAVLVLDENDNDPVFETYEMTTGYPKNSLSSRISTPQIIKVEATDADIGINAAINYYVENTDRVIIHPLTGVIYPSDQIYSDDEDFEITVIARDQNGAGRSSEPLHVLIRFLDESHISILTITDVLLEDMDTRLAQIETNTGIRVRALTASVLPNSEVTRKGRADGVTYLRVTGYALDQNDELVVTTQLQEVLENVQGLEVQALPDGDDGEVVDEESLTGWIVAVSVLSVLLALIIIAFILAYIFLFRKNKKYSNMNENESTPPSTTPTATPQFQKNSKLEINESKFGLDVSERRSTGFIFGQTTGGDTGESDTDESKETRKSVSFSANVERIDIEREAENDSQAKAKQDPPSSSTSAVKKNDEPEIEVHRL